MDEVREIGEGLGNPFPGPAWEVWILGEVKPAYS
jgi:GMP synthase PP-ATPase subunit